MDVVPTTGENLHFLDVGRQSPTSRLWYQIDLILSYLHGMGHQVGNETFSLASTIQKTLPDKEFPMTTRVVFFNGDLVLTTILTLMMMMINHVFNCFN